MQNQNTNRRKNSLRLKNYDYSKEGLYFVTLVTRQREHLFGEIKNGILKLTPGGTVANNCWLKIPTHFPSATLHEHIVMPNHIHGIIEMTPRVEKKDMTHSISDISSPVVRAEYLPPNAN